MKETKIILATCYKCPMFITLSSQEPDNKAVKIPMFKCRYQD